MASVTVNERIHTIDIVRGIAIFGILFVNMTFFNTSLQAIQWDIALWTEPWDQWVQAGIDFFVTEKFLAIFSFLFGYGVIMQRERTKTKGKRFVLLYLRRMTLLLIAGLIHGWFIWYGDILTHYAIIGFILLLFLRCRPRILCIWSVVFLMLVPTAMFFNGGTEGMASQGDFSVEIYDEIVADNITYGSGSFRAVQQQRLLDWNMSFGNQILFYPQILSLFLFGAYCAKRRFLHDDRRHVPTIQRIAWITGGIGWSLTFLAFVINNTPLNVQTYAAEVLDTASYLIGAPLAGIFYVMFFTLLLRNPKTEHAFRPIAAVGRTAFTNYIMQSVLCTFIFYSYGFGLFGRVSPLIGVGITVAVFLLQTFISTVWLKRFHMGPLEWLWRMGTHLAVSPLRKTQSPKGDVTNHLGGYIR